MMNDYLLPEETESEEYIKVETALIKGMKEMKILLEEAEENLLSGQYETYVKSYAYLKSIFALMGTLQTLLDDINNGETVAMSEIDRTISVIDNYVTKYEMEPVKTISHQDNSTEGW